MKLKPCPVCKNRNPELIGSSAREGSFITYYRMVHCPVCFSCTQSAASNSIEEAENEACRLWNRGRITARRLEEE